MTSTIQNIKHTQNLALAEYELSELFNIDLSNRNDTINHKFSILQTQDDTSVTPRINTFGIGRGGTVNSLESRLRNPDPRALSLYDHIPLRVNNSNDEFEDGNSRANYRLRRTVTRGTDTFYYYYLKTLSPPEGETELNISIQDFDGTNFTYNTNNLDGFLNTLDISETVNTTGILQGRETLQSSVSVRAQLSQEDINSVIEHFDDDSYGIISEIGLFFGKDSSVTVSGTSYTESLQTKLAYNQIFLPRNLQDAEFSNTIQIRNFYASRMLENTT